jgi:hypothetical protein
VTVPRQERRTAPLDDVEQEVARTCELVLRLASLADRYEAAALGRDRVALMRETVLQGQQALAALAAAERLDRRTPGPTS